jgi:hypothetical protein
MGVTTVPLGDNILRGSYNVKIRPCDISNKAHWTPQGSARRLTLILANSMTPFTPFPGSHPVFAPFQIHRACGTALWARMGEGMGEESPAYHAIRSGPKE